MVSKIFIVLLFILPNYIVASEDEESDVKPWLDRQQRIQEHLRENRHRRGLSSDSDSRSQENTNEEVKNIKPWLTKLQKIQQHIRELQDGIEENQETNPEIIKPWLAKLKKIKAHLNELRRERAGSAAGEVSETNNEEEDVVQRAPRHLEHRNREFGVRDENGRQVRVHHHMGRRPPTGRDHRFRADDY